MHELESDYSDKQEELPFRSQVPKPYSPPPSYDQASVLEAAIEKHD